MKSFDIKKHFLPIYLGVILLIIVTPSVWSYLQIIIPLFIISIGIHFEEKKVGFLGMILFYLFTVSQITIDSIERIGDLLIFSFAVLVPSILLLSQLLQEASTGQFLEILYQRKMQIAGTLIVAFCFLSAVYLIAQFIGGGLLFHSDAVQEQILLIAGISFLLFTPLLLKNTESKKESAE